MADMVSRRRRPPRRHYPHGNFPRETINDTITKELNGVLYDVMVKTSLEQVYDTKTDTTLTELLADIADAIAGTSSKADETYDKVMELLADAPESMNTFKEVWDYVRIDGDPKSALIELIDTKVDKEPGKGLSTHDLTDILYDKLVNDYTKEELDEKFQIIVDDMTEQITVLQHALDSHEVRITRIETTPNLLLSEDPDRIPEGLIEGDVYAALIHADEGDSGAIFS